MEILKQERYKQPKTTCQKVDDLKVQWLNRCVLRNWRNSHLVRSRYLVPKEELIELTEDVLSVPMVRCVKGHLGCNTKVVGSVLEIS